MSDSRLRAEPIASSRACCIAPSRAKCMARLEMWQQVQMMKILRTLILQLKNLWRYEAYKHVYNTKG